jgi:hypothetical protein
VPRSASRSTLPQFVEVWRRPFSDPQFVAGICRPFSTAHTDHRSPMG